MSDKTVLVNISNGLEIEFPKSQAEKIMSRKKPGFTYKNPPLNLDVEKVKTLTLVNKATNEEKEFPEDQANRILEMKNGGGYKLKDKKTNIDATANRSGTKSNGEAKPGNNKGGKTRKVD